MEIIKNNRLTEDAKTEMTEITKNNSQKILTFLLNDELYGFEISCVKEVIEYVQSTNITGIPLTPNYIAGVINLRGEVTPVIDLKAKFSNSTSNVTKRTCIIITDIKDDDESVPIGVMIDAVNAVVDIRNDDIGETPGFGAKIPPEFISGITKFKNSFIILLNINRVLNIHELSEFRDSNELTETLMLSNTEIL